MKTLKIINKMISNIQLNQTFILSFLLLIGVEIFELNISYLEIFTTFFTVILLDFLLTKYNTGKIKFPYSGVNAGFGISFFLRSEDLILYIFAGILAIMGKHFFKTKEGRHFFNPSNMGVFLVLVFFPQYSWINTLQWGNYSGIINYEYLLVVILVFSLGFFIIGRVKKYFKYNFLLTIIVPFLILHSILFFIIPFSENISGYVQFFSVSFLIFTFFMLTDPKTTPGNNYSRFFYIISVVLSFYILQFFINENYAILGSLFMNTLFLPIIWSLEKKYITVKSRRLFIFYLILLVLEIVSIYYLIEYNGKPDLLFDNVCDQLFCK